MWARPPSKAGGAKVSLPEKTGGGACGFPQSSGRYSYGTVVFVQPFESVPAEVKVTLNVPSVADA